MRVEDIQYTGLSAIPVRDFRISLFGLLAFAIVTGLTDPLVELTDRQLPMVAGETELGVATVLASEYIREAKSVIDDERDIVTTERDALRRFVREVEFISPSEGTRSGPTAVTVAAGDPGARRLRTIRNSFQETVMSVSHFDDEYDEGLRESMVAELDEETARALLEGRQFSRPLKQRVRYQAETARQKREMLLEVLSVELDSLETAQAQLQNGGDEFPNATETELLTKPFHELVERDRSLRREESRCEQLLIDRQREIHSESRSYSRSERPVLQKYLYDELKVTYPVLATATDRILQIRALRRSLLDAITRRY